ncbi:hypothetical protein F4827_004455 [Paraburkholderia bannensis]|uniref:DUF2968 domain-containing protein n=1 Tax=Paraburkholderia bannensis TaxID=765414 RepID=A0A7W9U037_9BURK|nr:MULTISPECIES: DUF2968 domain-containing protein [Paraburkholderia]MBB3259580.1 hypothetical protein [Paraburkholderia sp. WP4_3_2]MBB6104596.1 hypothetical protein [Paraburkholderia bannensis]
MDYKWRVRQVALAALLLIGGVETGCAQPLPDSAAANAAAQAGSVAAQDSGAAVQQAQSASAAQPLPGTPTALTPAEAQQSAAGNVAELQQMIRGSELNELRTTYNGTYGASLLFYGKEMTYYVALFQNKTFWRVIKTSDETRAELIYRDFVQKTLQLSDVEIRRTRLDAQKAFTTRMIALTQDHANRLQADLQVAQQQQAIVADQQKQTRDQANALQAEKAAAQDQLRAVQRQVRDLQRQVEGGLPVH